jgi:hypothetical protein
VRGFTPDCGRRDRETGSASFPFSRKPIKFPSLLPFPSYIHHSTFITQPSFQIHHAPICPGNDGRNAEAHPRQRQPTTATAKVLRAPFLRLKSVGHAFPAGMGGKHLLSEGPAATSLVCTMISGERHCTAWACLRTPTQASADLP